MSKRSMASVHYRVRSKTCVTKLAKRLPVARASQLQIQGEGTGSKLNGKCKSKGMPLDKDKSKSMPLDMDKGKSKSAEKQRKLHYKKRIGGGPGGSRKPEYVSVDVILLCAIRS